MAELFVALVMREDLKDQEGPSPDLAFVEAEDCSEAVKAISSYDPVHPRWQVKSYTRIVMIDSLKNYLSRKLVNVVEGKPDRRVRRRDGIEVRENASKEVRYIRRKRS